MRFRRRKTPASEAADPPQAGQPPTPGQAPARPAPVPPTPGRPAVQPGKVPPRSGQAAGQGAPPAVTAAQPPITGSQPAAPQPPPETQAQQLEGLRGWVAQLDRRLGTRTYVGAAVVVLSIAAGAVAIVLAVDARDNSANDEDLNEIRSQLATVVEQANATVTSQEDLDLLDARLSTLETEVSEGAATGDVDEKRITVIEDDIDDLRSQISEAGAGADSGASP